MALPELFENYTETSPAQKLEELLAEIPGKPGVCLLAAHGDKPIVLLYGTNIKMLVKRRLLGTGPEEKSRKADLRPLLARIYYKISYSKFETQLDFFHTAKNIYPNSWQKLFPRLNSWFIYLDNTGDVPIFKVGDDFGDKPLRHWGPFTTKVSADRMLESLVVIHKLCRCNKNLSTAPESVPCSYSQMNLCTMVCNGTTSISDYCKIIDQAVEFMDNSVDDAITRITTEIKSLSAQLEFEKAEKLSRVLDECKKLSGRAYKWVGPMERFKVICFQPGPNFKLESQKVREPGIVPILITASGIEKFSPVKLSERDKCCKELLEYASKCNQLGEQVIDKYLLAWVCQLLNKSDKHKGLFIKIYDQSGIGELAEMVKEYFTVKKKS